MAGSSKKVIYFALFGNTAIAVTKFVAAAFTGSSAMFSEGIHSVVDTGNQILLLFGLRQALLKQNKNEEAAEVEKRFNEAWKYSDVKLTSSRIL